MTDWEWVTNTGAVGKLPVRVLPTQQAEFLDLDFLQAVRDIRISYQQETETRLHPGDVCIFIARVSDVTTETEPAGITVIVKDVKFLQRGEKSRTEISEMMAHLDQARQRRQENKSDETCDNCEAITNGTRLSLERTRDGRDLHYCAQCDRLLSTKEYREWMEIHR